MQLLLVHFSQGLGFSGENALKILVMDHVNESVLIL